jgi:hypothetical protein
VGWSAAGYEQQQHPDSIDRLVDGFSHAIPHFAFLDATKEKTAGLVFENPPWAGPCRYCRHYFISGKRLRGLLHMTLFPAM